MEVEGSNEGEDFCTAFIGGQNSHATGATHERLPSSSGVLILQEHGHGDARPYYMGIHLVLKILAWPAGTAQPTCQTRGRLCRSMDTGKVAREARRL